MRVSGLLRRGFAINVLVVLACCFQVAAQPPEKPPPPADPWLSSADVVEPEAADIFYGLRQGKLIALERQTPSMHYSATGLMAMKVKSVFEFPGASSPIRFHSEDRLEFVVRSSLAKSEMDFNTVFSLRSLERRRKVRELLFSSGYVTPAGGSSRTNPTRGIVAVSFTRYGDHSLKVTAGPFSRVNT